MAEEWRAIEGFEGRYEISNHGRVKSLYWCHPVLKNHCLPVTIMKQETNNNGYKYILLRVEGKVTKYYIHRLVAFAFLEVIEDKDYVNHKDKDRTNNHVDNLEFMTHQENCDHRDGKCVDNDEPF